MTDGAGQASPDQRPKIARTSADLADSARIGLAHLSEAIGYRSLDRGMP